MTAISRRIDRASLGWPSPTFLQIAGVWATTLGLISMAAVLAGQPGLTSIISGRVPVAPNTGLCFALLGVAAILATSQPGQRQVAYRLLTAVVLVIGAVTLAQFLLGASWGIDGLLFPAPPGTSSMSPQTATAFVLLSASVLVPGGARRYEKLVTVVVAVVAAVSVINLLDVIYGATMPTILAGFTQMSVPTAATMLLLAVGAYSARPNPLMIRVLELPGPTGTFAKRLLFAAIAIPVVVTWLHITGERAGLYDTAYGAAIVALVNMALFLAVVTFTVRELARTDGQRLVAEEARETARAEAVAANQAKSEFLSRMSHELRTPLNSVLGFAQLLEMDDLTEPQRESVGYIQRAGRHLLHMINEVLDITSIDQGRLAISVEPVSLRDAIDEVAALIRPMANERSISVEVRLGNAETEYVRADRHRLRQVLLNLLSNAVKYNEPGGRITLRCETTAGDQVRISVSDTGGGIAPADLNRVFQPFDRLGAEATEVEGTGIGLALSEALAHAMGGQIGVESEFGEGSTFWVTLPAAAEPLKFDELPGPAIVAPDGGREFNVLYIEDNPANIRLVEQILARTPRIKLQSVMLGSTGVELAREHRPDAVLLDLHLPDIDGSEVLRRLRADPRTEDIPVLVISADGSPGRGKSLLNAGASGYLAKPINVGEFHAMLSGMLESGGQRANGS